MPSKGILNLFFAVALLSGMLFGPGGAQANNQPDAQHGLPQAEVVPQTAPQSGRWYEDGQIPDGLSAAQWAGIRAQMPAAGRPASPAADMPEEHTESAIVSALDGESGDDFGSSVALDGNMLVVGAVYEDGGAGNPIMDSGAAYVFLLDPNNPSNWNQKAVLRASDAQQNDYFGWNIAINGNTVIVGAPFEDGGAGDPIADSGAVYVFDRNQGGPDAWGEVRILSASDAQANDYFGMALGVSGDEIVVGASSEDGGAGDPLSSSGAAYIFSRDLGGPENWGEQTILRYPTPEAGDYFGDVTAIYSGTVAISAPYQNDGPGGSFSGAGTVYVFERDQGGPGMWGLVQSIFPSDRHSGDAFGIDVALNRDTLVVSAPYKDTPLMDAGAAYIFDRNQGGLDQWGEVTILHPADPAAQDEFGAAVAVRGDLVAIGAPAPSGSPDPGHEGGLVHTFRRDEGGANQWGQVSILSGSSAETWDMVGSELAVNDDWIISPASSSQQVYLFAEESAWGQTGQPHPQDPQAGDYFGSVALDGDLLVVGAPHEDGGAGDPLPDAGAAYVFARDEGEPGQWGQVAVLRPGDPQAGDNFGWAVDIEGDTIVVGAPYEDGGPGDPLTDTGAAYVFAFTPGLHGPAGWGQVDSLHASDGQAGDYFGFALDLDGSRLVVGAYGEDGGLSDPHPGVGAVYIFQYTPDMSNPSGWGQVDTLYPGNLQENSQFGLAVTLHNSTLIVGAPGEDGISPLYPEAGLVYVFGYTATQASPLGWGQVDTLSPMPPSRAGARFGSALAWDGNTLAVGAPFEDMLTLTDLITDTGAAYLFTYTIGLRTPAGWGQVDTITPRGLSSGAQFGASLSLGGDLLVVGAPYADGIISGTLQDAGTAYLFGRNQGGSNSWGLIQPFYSQDIQDGDGFGSWVATDGNTVAVGAPYEDGGSGDPLPDAGAAYIFEIRPANLPSVAYLPLIIKQTPVYMR